MVMMVYTRHKLTGIKKIACLSKQKTRTKKKSSLNMKYKNVNTKLESLASRKVVTDLVREKVDLIIISKNVKEVLHVKLGFILM